MNYRCQIQGMTGKLSVLTLLICLGNPHALTAATYYVSKTGLDTHACSTTDSAGTNKQTINAGIACLSSGDTLYVHTGTYNEAINFGTVGGSSWSSPTTVAAFSGETVTVQPNSGSSPVVYFHNAVTKYVILQGFILDGVNTNQPGADGVKSSYDNDPAQAADSIWIKDNEIKNAYENGILMGRKNNRINGNHIHNNT